MSPFGGALEAPFLFQERHKMKNILSDKTYFTGVNHAWAIVQRFENLPDNDPSLVLDENMMICNPLFCRALDYVIEHRDEDPEISLYFKAMSEGMKALFPTYYKQEDGSFIKRDPMFSEYPWKTES